MSDTTTPPSPAKKRKAQSRSDKRMEREIRYAQMSERLMVPREPFKRLAKEAIEAVPKSGDDTAFRVGKGALLTLQEAAENHLTVMFQQSRVVARNNKHRTLMRNDWWTAQDVMLIAGNKEPLHEQAEPESRRKGRARKAKTPKNEANTVKNEAKKVKKAAKTEKEVERVDTKRKRASVKEAAQKKPRKQPVVEEEEEEEEEEDSEFEAAGVEMEMEREDSTDLRYEQEEEASDLY